MKIETAVKVIQNDAKFLGLDFQGMIKFIEKSPLAQTLRVTEAYAVLKENGKI